jgi:ABC-type amino acid transport substrate-binding protein
MGNFQVPCIRFALALFISVAATQASSTTDCKRVVITAPTEDGAAAWLLNGKLTGASIDFTEMVAQKAGIKEIEWKSYPTWQLALNAVIAGEVDVITEVSKSYVRNQYLDFLPFPYSTTFMAIVIRAADQDILTESISLTGRSGAFIDGVYLGEQIFKKELDTLIKPKKISVLTSRDALALVLGNRADFAVVPERSFRQLAYQYNLSDALVVQNVYPSIIDNYIAFSKRSLCSIATRKKFAEASEELKTGTESFHKLLVKHQEIFNNEAGVLTQTDLLNPKR